MDRIHIGIDENGLGSRLGPLIVTAVAARTRACATTTRATDLAHLAHLLDDSKRLVSHRDVRLGEAWTRAIVLPRAKTPAELLERIGLDSIAESMKPCPAHVAAQCWDSAAEEFCAADQLVEKVSAVIQALGERDLEICSLRSAWPCTRILNDQLAVGHHRFLVDLHNMERLILDVRARLKSPIYAVCGKVGGIADYPKFFGPLAGQLHTVIEQSRERSVYEFAQLGQITFEQDADAGDALVMVASLVGKYLRELFMARIARRYIDGTDNKRPPSGYHDPVTNQFVDATALLRKSRRVPFDCFERRRNQ